jgi:hypothetical protein
MTLMPLGSPSSLKCRAQLRGVGGSDALRRTGATVLWVRPWPPEPARDLDAIGISARGGDHHAADVDVNRNLRKFTGDGMKERQSFRGREDALDK